MEGNAHPQTLAARRCTRSICRRIVATTTLRCTTRTLGIPHRIDFSELSGSSQLVTVGVRLGDADQDSCRPDMPSAYCTRRLRKRTACRKRRQKKAIDCRGIASSETQHLFCAALYALACSGGRATTSAADDTRLLSSVLCDKTFLIMMRIRGKMLARLPKISISVSISANVSGLHHHQRMFP